MILLLVGLCTYVGYGFSRYYVNRFEFMKEFRLFLASITLNINFTHERLASMILAHQTPCKELTKLLKNFLNCLDKKKLDDTLFDGVKLLKDEEKPVISRFFASLGHFDIENQTKQIEGFDTLFETWQKNAEQDKAKFGSLFIKLGLIIGVMISLILL